MTFFLRKSLKQQQGSSSVCVFGLVALFYVDDTVLYRTILFEFPNYFWTSSVSGRHLSRHLAVLQTQLVDVDESWRTHSLAHTRTHNYTRAQSTAQPFISLLLITTRPVSSCHPWNPHNAPEWTKKVAVSLTWRVSRVSRELAVAAVAAAAFNPDDFLTL